MQEVIGELQRMWPEVERALDLVRGVLADHAGCRPDQAGRDLRASNAGGRSAGERRFPLPEVSISTSIARERRLGALEGYLTHRDQFSDAQWTVVKLYFGDGLSQSQIALLIDRSRSAVSGLLTRAQNRKTSLDRAAERRRHEDMRRYLDS